MTDHEREAFVRAYIEAALWSSTDDDGRPLDNHPAELAPETRASMERDCDAFLAAHASTISEATCHNVGRAGGFASAGHDFWLTRNGHGVGFWDGDWSEPHATLLDAGSKAAGQVDLYVGDDGLIYSYGYTTARVG